MAVGTKPNPGDEALLDQLRQMILGFQVSQCLHVAAKLGIADLLKNGPMSGRELAVATRTEPAALDRFLRALSSHGVLTVDSEGRFCSTPIANFLRSGETHSLWAAAIYWGERGSRSRGEICSTACGPGRPHSTSCTTPPSSISSPAPPSHPRFPTPPSP